MLRIAQFHSEIAYLYHLIFVKRNVSCPDPLDAFGGLGDDFLALTWVSLPELGEPLFQHADVFVG